MPQGRVGLAGSSKHSGDGMCSEWGPRFPEQAWGKGSEQGDPPQKPPPIVVACESGATASAHWRG